MKFALKTCLGIFACLALVLLISSGVRAQDSDSSNENPAVTSSEPAAGNQPENTAAGSETSTTTAEQSPDVKAEQRAAECGAMGMGAGMHRWMESREEGMGMEMMPDRAAMMRMIARNPKMAGHMLQMRADMLRALADVMSKYAREMESGQWQSFQSGSAGQ